MSSTSTDEVSTAVVTPAVASYGDEGPSAATVPGSNFGRYVTIEEVGRGGMGRVFRAYDPKLQREVALKEVRRSAVDEQGAVRLVAEARAMAKLSHPNVVAIYDVEELAKEGHGQLVLVMEYVPGTTLSSWLRQQDRPWRDVVARFLEAGRGLSAAHAAGLLHRDFKPANVLVGIDAELPANSGAARWTVKVTDFGLAKGVTAPQSRTDGDSLSDSMDSGITRAGVVLGTPRYMAPEQHVDSAAPLTPAADQYAFCVSLWEALCREAPFSSASRPTTTAALLAKKRSGPPLWTSTSAPSRIGEIVRRGMAADPTKRWPNMDALLDALADDPGRRRGRRLRWFGAVGVLTLGAVGVAAFAANDVEPCGGARERLAEVWNETRRGEITSAFSAIEADYAARSSESTLDALDRYVARWADEHRGACEATAVRGEQSAAVMDLRMACLHRAKVNLGATVEVLAMADAEVIQRAHQLVEGLPPLTRCADTAALRADVEPPLPTEAAAVAAIRDSLALAHAQSTAGQYAAAKGHLDEAKAGLDDIDYGPVRTEVAQMEGDIVELLGQYDAAEAALREALRLAARWRQPQRLRKAATGLMSLLASRGERIEEALRYRELVEELPSPGRMGDAAAKDALAHVFIVKGDYGTAEMLLREALSIKQEVHGPDDSSVAVTRNHLAGVIDMAGRHAEAEAEMRAAIDVFERVFGHDHPDTSAARANLAGILNSQGRYAEAEVELRRAISTREKVLGADHADIIFSRNNLGVLLRSQGKFAEAEAEHRRAIEGLTKQLGSDHPGIAQTRTSLGNVLLASGRAAEAEIEHRKAIEIFESALGAENVMVGLALNNLGNALTEQGNLDEAEKVLHRTLELRLANLGPEHTEVGASRVNLGTLLHKRGKLEGAESQCRQGLAILERTLEEGHPHVALGKIGLALVLVDQGNFVEAVTHAESAWSQLEGAQDVKDGERAEAAYTLALALWGTGDEKARERSRELARQAIEGFSRAGDGRRDDAAEVREWLESTR